MRPGAGCLLGAIKIALSRALSLALSLALIGAAAASARPTLAPTSHAAVAAAQALAQEPQPKKQATQKTAPRDLYDEAADANLVVKAAVARAERDGKRVLLQWGADWCGWCHRFEDWARSEAVASTLGKDFVFTKIDIDRTLGGKALLEKTRGPKETGIPWFAFVDGDGKVVASSTTEAGTNLGCPWSPEEKAAFDTLLAAHGKRITADERAALLAFLGDKK